MTIGNPPFGRQGSKAMKFTKHASIFSTTISFILPRGFKKRSVYDRVPLNFWKVNEIGIPENSFIYNGEPFDVPCVWIEYEKKNKLRIKEKKLTPTIFEFTTQENANVSIRRVGVNAGLTFSHTEVSTPSHYFVKVDNVDEFVNKVNKIKFSDGDTTGPRSISKNELIKRIENDKDSREQTIRWLGPLPCVPACLCAREAVLVPIRSEWPTAEGRGIYSGGTSCWTT